MIKHIINTIIRAYPDRLIRAYVYLRFKIINTTIIEAILNYFRPERSTLMLGCGFGLFDFVLGLKFPFKKIHGIDINERRIAMAREIAGKLGLRNNTFLCADLSRHDAGLGNYDEILLLDLLHHIPPDAQADLLRKCHETLPSGGCMVIKDIHTANKLELFFTWLLDKLMTGGEPLYYRSMEDLTAFLKQIGFDVLCLFMDDILPYPHILYVCHKRPADQPAPVGSEAAA